MLRASDVDFVIGMLRHLLAFDLSAARMFFCNVTSDIYPHHLLSRESKHSRTKGQAAASSGIVRNNCDRHFSAIFLTYNLYDSHGVQIGSTSGMVENIEPHSAAHFWAQVDDQPTRLSEVGRPHLFWDGLYTFSGHAPYAYNRIAVHR